MAGASIRVEQKWIETVWDETSKADKIIYSYLVHQTRNITNVAIGDTLTREEVDVLITLGVDVIIVGPS